MLERGGASWAVSWALIGPHGPRCPASRNRTPRPLEGHRPATMEGHGPLATAREWPVARELRPMAREIFHGPWPMARKVRSVSREILFCGPWPVPICPPIANVSHTHILSLPLYPKTFTVRLKVERMDSFCSIENVGEWQNKKYETSRVTHLWSQEDNFLI
jgi:hypothetical protein